MDLQKYALDMLELAKGNLERDGDLMPVIFALDPLSQIHVIGLEFDGFKQKRAAYAKVTGYLRQKGIVAVVCINDTYYVKSGPEVPKEQVESIRPSSDPNRAEALVATLVLPDGTMSAMIMQPYTRDVAAEQIIWEPIEIMPNQGDGSEQNLLPPWGEVGLTQ